MSKPAARLGKGLSAIIGHRSTAVAPAEPSVGPQQRLLHIPLAEIRPNPRQPRVQFDDDSIRALADSIRANGILQPVLVRPAGPGVYELVAGERRWRAAQVAGMPAIPAIVRTLSDEESLALALLENIQREDLGPLERAAGYQKYMSAFGVTAEELATRLAESRANISNYLRLLKLRTDVQELISAGQLAMGQARAIAGIDDPQRQLALARLTVRRNLSVRQVEALAREESAEHDADRAPPRDAARNPRHVSEVEASLGRALGLNVRLFPGKKKNSGRIVIRYNSLEEFERVAERLGAGVLAE